MTLADRIIARCRTELPKATEAGLARLRVIIEEESKAATKERKRSAVSDEAAEIYELFPKHVGRDDALKAITLALKKHPKEYLMDRTNQFRLAVEAWPTSYRYFQDGGDRCPHPATWFNQGRYADDSREWRRAGARSGAPERMVSPQAKPSPEQEREHEEMVARYRAMPEPPKDSFEHALWEAARIPTVAHELGNQLSATPKEVQAEQHLRLA